MKLGELLRFRQGLNLNRENFSATPDFYWSEPVLEGTLSGTICNYGLMLITVRAQDTSTRSAMRSTSVRVSGP